ncbi:MAG: hypothetical protein P8Z37_14810 [Acidobacteriota bacterium]|jgi:hypothetical protein
MKKLCMAFVLGIGLLIMQGCSSTPSGTISVDDLLEQESELLGRHVVVVGRSDTKTDRSDFNMFKIYNKLKNVWVECPGKDSMPPQAEKIRVEGTLGKKKFSGMAEEQLYIEATSVSLE